MNRNWKVMAVMTAVLTSLVLPITSRAGPIYRCDGLAGAIAGTNGPDVIKGTPDTDWITGRGGADVISGLGGDDVICGGKGKDTLYAHDKAGFATCKGDAPETLLGGQGNDKLFAGGPSGRLVGGGGDDFIDGCQLRPITPTTIMQADYREAPGSIDARLWRGKVKGWGNDSLRHINTLSGSVYRDIVVGSDADESLRGNEGNDFIKGLGGKDELLGYLGDDEIRGDDGVAGNDTMWGQDGTDSCIGDEGDAKYDCES